MKKIKIAILDEVGLSFNWDSVETKTLGGSESSVIFMTRELAKLGVSVTVYNNCQEEGIFDGVRYINLSNIKEESYDILISQRNLAPFFNIKLRIEYEKQYNQKHRSYFKLVKNAKWKVVWLHDFEYVGQPFLQKVLEENLIDEVFTLSDNHFLKTIKEVNPDLSKNKFFHTRNGIVPYYKEIDLSKKDRNLFLFNATRVKGLDPLLRDVWPKIKKEIPNAKLKIIGGYYIRNNTTKINPVKKPEEFQILIDKFHNKDGIYFTGALLHNEVAKEYLDASYFIYPAIYPETFGISIVEGHYYGVPLIGCKYGAIEETSTLENSYLINGSYNRNKLEDLIEQVKIAYNEKELWEEKIKYNENYKQVLGWDSVALQWKIHFEKVLKMESNQVELEKHKENIKLLTKYTNKKFINKEDI